MRHIRTVIHYTLLKTIQIFNVPIKYKKKKHETYAKSYSFQHFEE